MSVNDKITNTLLTLGTGLLNRKKYDFTFNYSKQDFLKFRFLKKRLEQKLVNNNIYKIYS